MFRRLRLAILLYVLLFAAVGNFLAAARTTDWDATLWVDVYPINADGSARAQAHIDALDDEDFDIVEEYFAREAARYGVSLPLPFRLGLAPQLDNTVPLLTARAGMLDTMVWSLRMRWFAASVKRRSDRPSPDILLFALYYDGAATAVLDRSTALQRGLIAVTKVFADPASAGPNRVVFAHELLHTLGATDKYSPENNMPLFPHGFADPSVTPRYPQAKAELMAGRIAVEPDRAKMPAGLEETLVGPLTATEIGWLPAE
jgi:hypothetical protein